MQRILFTLIFVLVALGLARPADAVTIDLTYVQAGDAFGHSPTQFATHGPSNPGGGGRIQDVMRVAADVWENALPEAHHIDIEYGWQRIGGLDDVGRHVGRGVTISDGVTRNKGAWITFDPSFPNWYFDNTPEDDAEYGRFQESNGSYDGRNINDERRFTSPRNGAAQGLDLLTLAMHEIGHALGYTHSNLADYRYDTKRDERDGIRIAPGLPGSGAVIQMFGTHPDVADTLLMDHLILQGQRVFPSTLDIASIATISRYQRIESSFDVLRSASRNEVDQALETIVQLPGGGTQRLNLGDLRVLPEPTAFWALGGLLAVGRRCR